MIISASYKTDIPTFYGQWFINRVRAGFCQVYNPYSRKSYRVELSRGSVDGFIFWTKNIGPFLPYLQEVHALGYPFIVNYTINGYPRELESAVIDAERSIELFKRVRDSYGPHVPVWRYDTILETSLTPYSFHVHNFERLCRQLSGSTNEVIISYAQFYKKTRQNLDKASRLRDFTWTDPSMDEKRALTSQLALIASAHGIRLSICSQPEYLAVGSNEARCIDASRLALVAGHQFPYRQKGTRPQCGCHESRDIGDYDTCPQGCVYCYAVRRQELAQVRYKKHHPDSEFLFTSDAPPDTSRSTRRSLPLYPQSEE